MPDPIVITVRATPDAADAGKLNLEIDLPLVLLSFEDLDEARWVCPDGDMEVRFGPANNPFDMNPNSGGTYQTQPGGSAISGPVEEPALDPNPDLFVTYKYSIVVTSTDRTRVGTLDPHFKVRRRSVYRGAKGGGDK